SEPRTPSVPGVVGEATEWILATARRPNRVLALAAAIPLVGTLIGRRVAGPTRSATHLYAVAVAPTGAGKQHPIDCITALMAAAGPHAHIGPHSLMSAPAPSSQPRHYAISSTADHCRCAARMNSAPTSPSFMPKMHPGMNVKLLSFCAHSGECHLH